MTLDPTATHIYCQTCATAWPRTSATGQYYFRGTPGGERDIGSYTSPADIVAAGEEMTFCPSCDTEQLSPSPIPNAPPGVRGRDQFYTGDDKMIGADTDAADPGEGDADVTHRVP